jgi:hypothetical protein
MSTCSLTMVPWLMRRGVVLWLAGRVTGARLKALPGINSAKQPTQSAKDLLQGHIILHPRSSTRLSGMWRPRLPTMNVV